MVQDTENRNREKLKQISYESTRSADFGDISAVSGSKMPDPLEYLRNTQQIGVCELLEAIIFWTQKKLGVDEFISARQEFFNLTGRIFPDDYFYHQRISYFLDFFTFQRPIQILKEADKGHTPFSQFVCSSFFCTENIPQDLQKKFYDLANFRHSLFKVVRVRKNGVILKDIFAGDKIHVIDSAREMLFQCLPCGAVYQGFLFHMDGKIHLSQGLLLHPPSVSRLIARTVRRLEGDYSFNQMKYMANLARLNLNHIRHTKSDAKKVYAQLEV